MNSKYLESIWQSLFVLSEDRRFTRCKLEPQFYKLDKLSEKLPASTIQEQKKCDETMNDDILHSPLHQVENQKSKTQRRKGLIFFQMKNWTFYH